MALAMVLSFAWYCDPACFRDTLCVSGRADDVPCLSGVLLLEDRLPSGHADSSAPGSSHLHETLGKLCQHLSWDRDEDQLYLGQRGGIEADRAVE